MINKTDKIKRIIGIIAALFLVTGLVLMTPVSALADEAAPEEYVSDWHDIQEQGFSDSDSEPEEYAFEDETYERETVFIDETLEIAAASENELSESETVTVGEAVSDVQTETEDSSVSDGEDAQNLEISDIKDMSDDEASDRDVVSENEISDSDAVSCDEASDDENVTDRDSVSDDQAETDNGQVSDNETAQDSEASDEGSVSDNEVSDSEPVSDSESVPGTEAESDDEESAALLGTTITQDSDEVVIKVSAKNIIIDMDSSGRLVVSAESDTGDITVTTYTKTSSVTRTELYAMSTISLGANVKGRADSALVKNTLTMSLADIILMAQNILLVVPDDKKDFTWTMKSLTAEATDMDPSTSFFNKFLDLSKIYDTDDYIINIENVNIEATGDVNLKAGSYADISASSESATVDESTTTVVQNEDGEDESPTALAKDSEVSVSGWRKIGGAIVDATKIVTAKAGELIETGYEKVKNAITPEAPFSMFFAVKNSDHLINIRNSSITGASVSATASTDYSIQTISMAIGIAVNFVNANTRVYVNDSYITATAGDVDLKADKKINISATSTSGAGPLSKYSVALGIVNGDTKVEVIGSDIDASKDINISAASDVTSAVVSQGKKANLYQQILSVGVNYASGDTSASVTDSKDRYSMLSAGGDINVTSDNKEVFRTEAKSQQDAYTKFFELKISASVSRIKNLVIDGIFIVLERAAGSAGSAIANAAAKLEISKKIMSLVDQFKGSWGVEKSDSTCQHPDMCGEAELKFQIGKGVQAQRGTPVVVTLTPVSLNEPELTELTAPVTKTAFFNEEGFSINFGSGAEEIYAGTWKYSFTDVPLGTVIKEGSIYVEAGKKSSKKIEITKADTAEDQYAGTFAFAYTNTDGSAYIDSKGMITAGGELNVHSTQMANSDTNSDASGVDTIYDEPPVDAEIRVAVFKQDLHTAVPGYVFLENESGTVKSGQIRSEILNVFSRVARFELNKVGDYKVYFYVDSEQYTLSGAAEYTEIAYNALPEGIRNLTEAQEHQAGNFKWYYKNISLDFAHRYIFKDDDTILYNPLTGAPMEMEYIPGKVVSIILFQGVTENELKAPEVSSTGIGIGLNIYDNDNNAYIKNADIKASGVNVEAAAGTKEAADPKNKKKNITYNNASNVEAKAGYRSGKTGFAGSIAVNYAYDDVNAYIENSIIEITNGKDVAVKAGSNMGTKVVTGAVGAIGIKSVNATGGGITGDYLYEKVNAYISSDTKITGAADLSISAGSKGNTTDQASAGENTSGNDGKMGALGIIIVTSDVKAELKGSDTCEALSVSGDVNVKASSERTANIKSGASAKGATSVKGITIGLSVATFYTNAIVDRAISGSENISVEAIAKNGGNVTTVASTSGCSKKAEDGEANVGANQAGNDALIAADIMVDDANNINGDDYDNEPIIPDAMPINPDTAEGSVEWAGTLALLVYNNKVNAYIKKNTVTSGNLTVEVRNTDNLNANADASAVIGKKGIAVGVALLWGKTDAKAYVTGNHSAQSVDIICGQTETEAEGKTVTANNAVNMEVLSGAGASDMGFAGALAIDVYQPTYEAYVGDGEDNHAHLTIGTGKSSVKALQGTNINVYAGADPSLTGVAAKANGKGGTGIGGSVAADYFAPAAKALVCTGSYITSKGDVLIYASTENAAKTEAVAGSDCYLEPAIPKKLTINFKNANGDTILQEGLKVTVSEYEAQASGQIVNVVRGKMVIDYTDKPKSYYIWVTGVPEGYRLDGETKNVRRYYLDENGFTETIILYKEGEAESKQDTVIDAAVGLNMISSDAIASVENGATVSADGSVEVNAYGKTAADARTKGSAQAEKVVVGASTAWNFAYEDIAARIEGYVYAGGENLKVNAVSDSTDSAHAQAVASGLELKNIAKKLNIPNEQLSSVLSTFDEY
ncbi:MAG: hypothetical protein HUJ76_03460, partial [Parasporobacterium sp.]|nr:hypothetical protein [Parasporobacterium sp.]